MSTRTLESVFRSSSVEINNGQVKGLIILLMTGLRKLITEKYPDLKLLPSPVNTPTTLDIAVHSCCEALFTITGNDFENSRNPNLLNANLSRQKFILCLMTIYGNTISQPLTENFVNNIWMEIIKIKFPNSPIFEKELTVNTTLVNQVFSDPERSRYYSQIQFPRQVLDILDNLHTENKIWEFLIDLAFRNSIAHFTDITLHNNSLSITTIEGLCLADILSSSKNEEKYSKAFRKIERVAEVLKKQIPPFFPLSFQRFLEISNVSIVRHNIGLFITDVWNGTPTKFGEENYKISLRKAHIVAWIYYNRQISKTTAISNPTYTMNALIIEILMELQSDLDQGYQLRAELPPPYSHYSLPRLKAPEGDLIEQDPDTVIYAGPSTGPKLLLESSRKWQEARTIQQEDPIDLVIANAILYKLDYLTAKSSETEILKARTRFAYLFIRTKEIIRRPLYRYFELLLKNQIIPSTNNLITYLGIIRLLLNGQFASDNSETEEFVRIRNLLTYQNTTELERFKITEKRTFHSDNQIENIIIVSFVQFLYEHNLITEGEYLQTELFLPPIEQNRKNACTSLIPIFRSIYGQRVETLTIGERDNVKATVNGDYSSSVSEQIELALATARDIEYAEIEQSEEPFGYIIDLLGEELLHDLQLEFSRLDQRDKYQIQLSMIDKIRHRLNIDHSSASIILKALDDFFTKNYQLYNTVFTDIADRISDINREALDYHLQRIARVVNIEAERYLGTYFDLLYVITQDQTSKLGLYIKSLFNKAIEELHSLDFPSEDIEDSDFQDLAKNLLIRAMYFERAYRIVKIIK